MSQSLGRAFALPLWHRVERSAPGVALTVHVARAGAWAALHAALKKEQVRAKQRPRRGSVRSGGTPP